MGSNIFLGFLFGIGVGGWVYSKILRSTGGNVKNSLAVAAVACVFATIILATILSSIKR